MGLGPGAVAQAVKLALSQLPSWSRSSPLGRLIPIPASGLPQYAWTCRHQRQDGRARVSDKVPPIPALCNPSGVRGVLGV